MEAVLSAIREQTGVELELCDYFTGWRECNGLKYFNAVLKDRIGESQDYVKLERFAKRYKLLRFEPNGLKRIAVLMI